MPDLIETSLAGPRALRAAVDFLARLPEVESAISSGAGDVQRVLDELFERVRPIQGELTQLRESAQILERRLAQTEVRAAELDKTASELILVAARLEGAVEHLLDKVPGLSSAGALKRSREVVEAITR